MDKKEANTLAIFVSSDKKSFMKLMVTGLILNTATAKLNLYLSKNMEIAGEIREDEMTLELLREYYIECKDELILSAEESLFTSNEAEQNSDHYYDALGEIYQNGKKDD